MIPIKIYLNSKGVLILDDMIIPSGSLVFNILSATTFNIRWIDGKMLGFDNQSKYYNIIDISDVVNINDIPYTNVQDLINDISDFFVDAAPLVAADLRQLEIRVDTLEEEPINKRTTVQVKLISDSQSLSNGSNKYQLFIPEDIDNYKVSEIHTFCTTPSSSGAIQVQFRNSANNADILDGLRTIDVNQYNSYTSTIQPNVIETSTLVTCGSYIILDVISAGTGVKGFGFVITFEK